jgi:hypothetical protein
MKAEKFVAAVGGDVKAFEAEFLAGEPEYQSRLIDWARLRHLFAGDLDALDRFHKLEEAWSKSLDLAGLDALEKRAEGLHERMRREYVLAENGIVKPAKTFEEWSARLDLMERDQVRKDGGDIGSDLLKSRFN